jgi:hypothetical protein
MMVSKSATQRIGPTVASLLAGTACANYLTPVIMHFLPEKVQGQGKYAVAFMMGFMGLKGLELAIEKYMKSGAPKEKAASRGSRKVKRPVKAKKKGKKK